jgi:hypothetical protein
LPKCRVVAATTAPQFSSLVTSSGSNRAAVPIADRDQQQRAVAVTVGNDNLVQQQAGSDPVTATLRLVRRMLSPGLFASN